MKIRAKVSFCGFLSMGQGEVREYSNEAVLADLLEANYIEKIEEKDTDVKDTDNIPIGKLGTKRRGASNESK